LEQAIKEYKAVFEEKKKREAKMKELEEQGKIKCSVSFFFIQFKLREDLLRRRRS